MSEYVLDYVWAFAVALIITFALTPLVKRFAVAVGAIDKPDARKVHHGAIPRLGGLAIFLGYVGSVLFNDSIPHDHKLFGFVLGTVILVLVGIWDDIKQIEPKTKLMGQIIAAAILVAYDIRVDFISLPSLGWCSISQVLGYSIDYFLDSWFYKYCKPHRWP